MTVSPMLATGISVWTSVVIPIVVAAATAVITALVTMVVTRANAAANLRRDRYAQAVQSLVAWVEFPYRVRRRTDDSPETLSTLASLGHDLQERLACHQAWIGTEHPALARTYEQTRSAINEVVGPAVAEAWDTPPVTSAAGMNLGTWGTAPAAKALIAELQRAVEVRFGARRVLEALRSREHRTPSVHSRSVMASERSR